MEVLQNLGSCSTNEVCGIRQKKGIKRGKFLDLGLGAKDELECWDYGFISRTTGPTPLDEAPGMRAKMDLGKQLFWLRIGRGRYTYSVDRLGDRDLLLDYRICSLHDTLSMGRQVDMRTEILTDLSGKG